MSVNTKRIVQFGEFSSSLTTTRLQYCVSFFDVSIALNCVWSVLMVPGKQFIFNLQHCWASDPIIPSRIRLEDKTTLKKDRKRKEMYGTVPPGYL